MTLPFERIESLNMTKRFLRKLLNPKATPRVPKKIRMEAYFCLKHFPEDGYLVGKKKELLKVFK